MMPLPQLMALELVTDPAKKMSPDARPGQYALKGVFDLAVPNLLSRLLVMSRIGIVSAARNRGTNIGNRHNAISHLIEAVFHRLDKLDLVFAFHFASPGRVAWPLYVATVCQTLIVG